MSTLRERRGLDSVLPAAKQVFVDDPWVALSGSPDQCARMTAVLVIVWRILGVGLAFGKGQLGDRVNWIGASIAIESYKTILVSITKARLEELAEVDL